MRSSVRAMRLERREGPTALIRTSRRSLFRSFRAGHEIVRLAVMLYIRFPLSHRNVKDLLPERGIEVSHETVRVRRRRFGPMFAAEILRQRVGEMRSSGCGRTSRRYSPVASTTAWVAWALLARGMLSGSIRSSA
jgi:hypothetical protein